MRRQPLMWSLTGIGALLGFMLTVQLTSRPQANQKTDMSSYIDLRTQVQEQLEEHQILMQDISKQNAQLAEFQASRGNTADLQRALQKDADTIAAEAGLTPITGNGLTLTIQDDASLPFIEEFAGQFGQTADIEISHIVNDLFANGATAISINGQRLVTTSSIRLVSGVGGGPGTLQINTYPIAQPYVITAVGDVNLMQAVLTVNHIQTDLNMMQEDFIVKAYTGSQHVTVPKYTGALPGNVAKEVNAQ